MLYNADWTSGLKYKSFTCPQLLQSMLWRMLVILKALQHSSQRHFQLRLPSQLALHLPCNQQLHECEWELWYAQAHDALNNVRQHICLFTHLNTFRMVNVRGQCASTCARTTLDLAVEKKHVSKAKYDAARDALTALAPLLEKFSWTNVETRISAGADWAILRIS
ncbi:hypothetical protein DFJ58DRAFT_728843 [Suillus subalutaceus]|uniref:uncharacterized protein n=1 Tax=Suillus subalutaceus TaxID=48586 RepID=UPI001B878CC9|nr:uncharacterized protein DFJ58DRAFT_728843 [Suillus subalutaceus]KAG1851621.1 hypothetical protein DFJ58DRAFT_728843 [Suillus subalutaceus]